MQFNLLGTLEVLEDGRNLAPTAAKPRQVLALLTVSVGAMVSAEQLIDDLWPDGPPTSAKTTLQTYVYQLRKLLDRSSVSSRGKELLATRPAGYILPVPRGDVDIFRFQRLMEDGRKLLRRGDASGAADLLRDSLKLWRGPMLADVTPSPRIQGHTVYLEEKRMEALSLRIEADLESRRHQEIVGELQLLVTRHRLHEDLYIQLMRALHRSGRRGEALAVYRQLCVILDDELGLEPSVNAKQFQHLILAS
jgi:DNA-binding SARP family transcriptional activator